MKNIYFYGLNLLAKLRGETVEGFPAAVLYLNSYIKVERPDLFSQIQWKKIQLTQLTQDQLIDDLLENEIDIVCLSVYIWNSLEILKTIAGIKEKLPPHVKLIVGGPSISVFSDPNFLTDNPDIDYAIYAQGEQGFAHALDSVINNKKLSMLTSRNIAWVGDDGKQKVAMHELAKLNYYSPYLESEELINQIVSDPAHANVIFRFPYETSKGCPYNCTFCDWSSGLTHKTYFRKFDAESEIDLLGRYGLTRITLADANFGQIARDVDIANTFAKLKKEKGYQFLIAGSNFSKLQKTRVFEILKIFLENELIVSPSISLQDIHPAILKNIDRPDIPWADHKKLIETLKEQRPEFNPSLELIQGLPGQTRETWADTLVETLPYQLAIYNWNMLPNSPASYDLAYREEMKIKTGKMTLQLDANVKYSDELVDTVVSTYSYDETDYLYFTLLAVIRRHPKFLNLYDKVFFRKLITLVSQSENLPKWLETTQTNLVNGAQEFLMFSLAEDIIFHTLRQNKLEFSQTKILDFIKARNSI